MIFNASEKRGALLLLTLIAGILIIPRRVLPETTDIFFITAPAEVGKDSLHTTIRPSAKTTILKKTAPVPCVELNSADSAQLVALPGIGPYYASRILRYRERLGGYHSIHQLKELKMKYFNIDSNVCLFSVNPALIRKAEMDTMSFKAILRHPYLEYEDVQLIFNAKRKHGHISYSVLEEQGVLPAHKLKKIKPYFK